MMRLARRATMLFAFYLLAGCGVSLSQSDWRAPAGREWTKDSYECEIEARSVSGHGGTETFGQVQRLTERCLVARGYVKR
jgi:hypothetical protein